MMALAPDGRTIASLYTYDEGATLWDVSNRSRRATLKADRLVPNSMAWSPDGQYSSPGASGGS